MSDVQNQASTPTWPWPQASGNTNQPTAGPSTGAISGNAASAGITVGQMHAVAGYATASPWLKASVPMPDYAAVVTRAENAELELIHLMARVRTAEALYHMVEDMAAEAVKGHIRWDEFRKFAPAAVQAAQESPESAYDRAMKGI